MVAAVLVLVLGGALIGVDARPAEAAFKPSAEQKLRKLTNQDRVSRGLPAYRACKELKSVARKQARRMADRKRLYHTPNLGRAVPQFRRAAENVGRGSTVRQVQKRFMKSRPHRASVLSRRYTQFGVGVDRRNGQVWVAVVFRQPTRGARCS